MPRHNVSTKLYGVNRDNGNDTDVQRDVHRRFNKRRKEGSSNYSLRACRSVRNGQRRMATFRPGLIVKPRNEWLIFARDFISRPLRPAKTLCDVRNI